MPLSHFLRPVKFGDVAQDLLELRVPRLDAGLGLLRFYFLRDDDLSAQKRRVQQEPGGEG